MILLLHFLLALMLILYQHKQRYQRIFPLFIIAAAASGALSTTYMVTCAVGATHTGTDLTAGLFSASGVGGEASRNPERESENFEGVFNVTVEVVVVAAPTSSASFAAVAAADMVVVVAVVSVVVVGEV